MLLGYSRQSYYQGISYIQQKAYEADIIIEEVLRYRDYFGFIDPPISVMV
ncbi:MAG: hypothetical protein ACK5ZY_04235 [Cyclobacteriaceae bacterium]